MFDLSTFRLNSPLGKRILATARSGNYAHPGEEDAIVTTLAPLAESPNKRWLDAGCGRGGTAAYVAKQGWARVTAFDIDSVSIAEARETYPEVEFYACSVEEAPVAITERYDLIYAFNAFYAFPDQPAALRALRQLASEDGALVLFDYVDHGGFYESALYAQPETKHWQPIHVETFPQMLKATGWTLESLQDLDADYVRWYEWLVERFDNQRTALLEFAPPEAIDYAKSYFARLLAEVRAGVLGGGIFIARAS